MQYRLRPHLQPAQNALRAIDWRRWYAASMVGLAAFLIGLVLWPSKPLVRRTTAVIQVDTSALPAARLLELEADLLAIQDDLLSEDRLKSMIAELESGGVSPQDNIDVPGFRQKLHVIPDELPEDNAENPGMWWIRFAMNGSGSEAELRLVNRVATEFALEWQRRLVDVEQGHEVRDVRSAMLDVLRRQSELSEQADEVSRLQSTTLMDAFRRLSQPASSEHSAESLNLNAAESPRNQSADARAFQLASSTPRELPPDATANQRNANGLSPYPPGGAQIENPQWRTINDRLQKVQQRRYELQQANPHWSESHWELRQLADEASFLANQLNRVPRYESSEPSRSPSTRMYPESLNGIASVETNQFYRPPADRDPSGSRGSQEAQPVRFTQPSQEELASLQSEVMAPMESLRAIVVANKAAHDQAMQALNSIVLKAPKIHQGEAHLVQPATTYLLASTNGTWRIIFLMLTSISGAVFFGTVFRTELDSRLSSSHEIETNLGVPVIGYVGETNPNAEPTWLERLQPANTILRSAEGIVFALFALIFVTILFNSRLAVDLAESPLLTISEILGSFFRRG